MLTASFSVLSVAPDDFASECTPYAKPGSFNNPNQKVLLDTQFYPSTTLLSATGDDGLWLSLDFDMTTGAGAGKWADLSQSSTCKHNLKVCAYTDGAQDNWMITQYINISRTGVTELLLNATFLAGTSSACNGVCTDSVRVRIFETNEPDEVARSDTSNYNGNVASLEHIMDQNPVQKLELEPISISGSYTGLYLAVLDLPPGTCISISHLALFYFVCPEQVVNLVKYPETISPKLLSDSDVFLEPSCVDNAEFVAGDEWLECSRRGRWEINNRVCNCMEGHYLCNDNCEPCPPGLYKDVVGNDVFCSVCPTNSNSTLPGSAICTCNDGYYRTSSEGASDPCTAAPTKPVNWKATATGISVTLSWDPPIYNGGRDDVFYIIKYYEEGKSTYYSPTPPITDTSATITPLAPLSTYALWIVAENGVTQEFPDLFIESDRTSSTIFAFTKEAVPNAPEVTVVGEGVAVVFWEPPEITNGLIVNYELRFTGIGDKTTLLVDGEVLYYIPSSADIPHSNNGTVTVQVRGTTAMKGGIWSDPQTISVCAVHSVDSACSDTTTSSTAAIVTSVFVTGFISSGATAIITIIVCMVMQKRRRSKESVPSKTSPGPDYDDLTEICQRKTIFKLDSDC